MNPVFQNYIDRHPRIVELNDYKIEKSDIIVVIPIYLEDDVQKTLNSLIVASQEDIKVSILLVVNACVNSSPEVLRYQEKTIEELEVFIGENNNRSLSFCIIKALGLPGKHFGAGLARKVGMDEAVRYFMASQNDEGIIVSLDADSIVEENYFNAIHKFFKSTKNIGCSIYFEHPVSGEQYDDEVYKAIIQYELHLRYYVACLRYMGFPYAFHTVGSCFAVKAIAYARVGGMNRRQGGEDFYFLHKLAQLGSMEKLVETKVVPSPRVSERVPFGTGPTVKKIIAEGDFLTYNLQGFIDLKELFDDLPSYFNITGELYQKKILELSGRVRSFLLNTDFERELISISSNSSNEESFKKRFYSVFNAFKIVKYLNYIHEHFVEKVPVYDASLDLLQVLGEDTDDLFEEIEILEKFRQLDRAI